MILPEGTKLIPLKMHPDYRGVFTEVFREEWGTMKPVQWNLVESNKGVLRGVHVHPIHDDYLIIVHGSALVGLKDLRAGSSTEGLTAIVPMNGAKREALVTPHGVAHGFYFETPAIHLYAVSHYWNLADELGCRWDDPELGIPWPMKEAILSEKDEKAISYRALMEKLRNLP